MTRRFPAQDRESGAATVLLLLFTPALFGVAGLVLDGGRQLSARQQAAGLAEQAARAGADRLDADAIRRTPNSTGGTGVGVGIDTTAATRAACRFVETSDPAATCTAQVVGTPAGQQVRVDVTSSSPTVLLGLVGVNRLHVHSNATATAVTGIRTVLGQG
jgi:Flp pilus assembly protein TadG